MNAAYGMQLISIKMEYATYNKFILASFWLNEVNAHGMFLIAGRILNTPAYNHIQSHRQCKASNQIHLHTKQSPGNCYITDQKSHHYSNGCKFQY